MSSAVHVMLADRLLSLSQQKGHVFLCNQEEFGKRMACVATCWGGWDWCWWWLCSLTVLGKEGRVGAGHCRWQNYCAAAGKCNYQHATSWPNLSSKPRWFKDLSLHPVYTLCNKSVDDSRCSSKAFPPHCLFSRVRFVPWFLFSLSSLPWTLCSRVLELIIYGEMMCKGFLS